MELIEHFSSSYEGEKSQITIESYSAARILNFNLVPKRFGQNQIVGNVFQFLSRNTYGLLIAGVVTLMISIILITIACVYRSNRLSNSKNNNKSNTVGFHRYNQVSNSDVDEEESLSIKLNSNGVKHQNNSIGSKITKLINGGNQNVNFKLLNRLSDDEEDEEEETFTR